MPTTVTLPWFTVENHELLLPLLGLKEMVATLKKGGFTVLQIFDIDGQILNPEISGAPVNHIRFDVLLPRGWSCVEGYNGYGFKDRELLHLLDSAGHLRGRICLEWRDNYEPMSADIYCRYALNPFAYQFSLKKPEGCLVDAVVDRAALNPQKPAEFPVVVQTNTRPARKGPIDFAELSKRLDETFAEEKARIEAGEPQLNLPIHRWLHENYPDWRNPFAYW